MTALNFPPQPQDVGNTYVGGNGVTYVWSGTIWTVAGNPGSTGNVVFAGNTIATASGGNVTIQAGSFDWTFTKNGTLLVPSPVSNFMFFSLDSTSYVPTEGKPALDLTGSPWQLQGQFVYSLEGVVSLELNNPFPEYVNPGYDSNDAFAFGSDITGIPNYTLVLALLNVQHPGEAGWTANIGASESPAYPPSLQSRGATQITSGEVSYVLGADGHLLLPDNVSGIPTEISLNGGPAVGYTTATNVPTVTDSGGGAGMTVDIVADGFSISSVAINQPGQGYAPGDQLQINQPGSTGNGEITVTATRSHSSMLAWPGLGNLSFDDSGSLALNVDGSVWSFNTDGSTTLPDGEPVYFGNGNALIQAGMGFHINSEEGIAITAINTDTSTNYTWGFSTDGTLYVPPGSYLKADVSSSVGLATNDGNTIAYADPSGFFIDTLYNSEEYQWCFDNTGNLTLPIGGTINFADGSNALVGGGGGPSSSLVSSNSVYNVNINDNGVFTVVQDINAPATASLSLNSDTQANLRWVSDIANPGSNPATWVYVNSDGVNFQTFRNAPFNQYNAWQFDNNGTTLLPPGGAIASVNDSIYLTSNVVAVGNVLQTNTAFLQGRSINGASTFTVNALGTQGWISQYGAGFGPAPGIYGSAVATDAGTGEIYSYGGQGNTATVNSMIKYDAAGNVLWQNDMTWPIGSLAEGIGLEPHTRSLFAATQVYHDLFNTFSVSNLSTTDGTLVWETEININGSGGSYYRPYLYDMAYSRVQGASSGNLWINHDGYNGVTQRAIAITQLDSVTGLINWSHSYRNSFESGAATSLAGGIVTEYQPNATISSNNAYVSSTGFYTPHAALVGKVGEDGNGSWLTRFTYQSADIHGVSVAYDGGNVFAGGTIFANPHYTWLSSMDAVSGTPHWTTRWTNGVDGAEGITAVAGAGNLYVAGLVYDSSGIGITVSQINQTTGSILWINELNTAWPYGGELMDYLASSAHALDWDSSDPQSPLVITWINIAGGMAGDDSNQVTMRVPSDGSLIGEYGPWIYRNIAGGITEHYNDLTVTTGGNLSAVPLTATTTTGNVVVTTADEPTWLNAMGPAAAWTFDQSGNLTLPLTSTINEVITDGLYITPGSYPTQITISGADFTAVNLTYTYDAANGIWIPAGYNPSSDPSIAYADNQWGIEVPGFPKAIYVNHGSLWNPLAQWATNPPYGTVPPTGTYVYRSNSWLFGSDGNLTLPANGGIISSNAMTIQTTEDMWLRSSGVGGIGMFSGNSQLAVTGDLGIVMYGDEIGISPNDGGYVLITMYNSNNFVQITGPVGSWTFDQTGNLTLPPGGTINWHDGSNALVGGGSVAFNPTTLVQSVNITAAGTQGGGGEYAVTYTTSSLATVIATGIVVQCQGSTAYVEGTTATGSQVVTGTFGDAFADRAYTAYAYVTTNVGTIWSAQASGTTGLCLIAGTVITMANGTTKRIEDISYDDHIRVWDFDTAGFATARALWIKRVETAVAYNELVFSDGSVLRTVDQHRIFNKQAGAFTYPMTDDTPLGTITHTVDGAEVVLVSKRTVTETVDYYNVITDRHMNLFANGILTSCRFSNAYPIADMRWVKASRTLRDRAEFVGIADRWIDGLRLCEQTYSVEDCRWYVRRLESLEITELALAA